MTEQASSTISTGMVQTRPKEFRIPWGNIFTYAVLTLGGIVVMLPFLWMLSASFKPEGDILVYPPQLIPRVWTLDNFRFVLEQTQFLTFVKNSLIIVAFTITGHVVSGSLVAFGFARFRFPGRNALFLVLLGTLMIPFHAYMIPRFMIMKSLGVLDSLVAVFLPYLFGGPVYIFLLRQFFMTIPRELDDAARIDGCNSFQLFWRVIFPLALPAVMTVAVLEFLAGWTSFLEPLIYLNSQNNLTVALGLSQFKSGFGGMVQWGPLMAATAMSAIAPLIVFSVAQKYLMGGIASIGLKG